MVPTLNALTPDFIEQFIRALLNPHIDLAALLRGDFTISLIPSSDSSDGDPEAGGSQGSGSDGSAGGSDQNGTGGANGESGQGPAGPPGVNGNSGSASAPGSGGNPPQGGGGNPPQGGAGNPPQGSGEKPTSTSTGGGGQRQSSGTSTGSRSNDGGKGSVAVQSQQNGWPGEWTVSFREEPSRPHVYRRYWTSAAGVESPDNWTISEYKKNLLTDSGVFPYPIHLRPSRIGQQPYQLFVTAPDSNYCASGICSISLTPDDDRPKDLVGSAQRPDLLDGIFDGSLNPRQYLIDLRNNGSLLRYSQHAALENLNSAAWNPADFGTVERISCVQGAPVGHCSRLQVIITQQGARRRLIHTDSRRSWNIQTGSLLDLLLPDEPAADLPVQILDGKVDLSVLHLDADSALCSFRAPETGDPLIGIIRIQDRIISRTVRLEVGSSKRSVIGMLSRSRPAAFSVRPIRQIGFVPTGETPNVRSGDNAFVAQLHGLLKDSPGAGRTSSLMLISNRPANSRTWTGFKAIYLEVDPNGEGLIAAVTGSTPPPQSACRREATRSQLQSAIERWIRSGDATPTSLNVASNSVLGSLSEILRLDRNDWRNPPFSFGANPVLLLSESRVTGSSCTAQ